MAVNVGILGLGFMGNCHFSAYSTNESARVAALCDSDATRLEADAAVAGNIAAAHTANNSRT